jgi:AraC-like DNA-binding protein
VAVSKVLTFTDPFPYQAAIRAADVEIYPTAKGEFRAKLTQINLNQLWMQRFHERLPQIHACKVRPGRRVIGFLTTADQPAVKQCGREISPHEIIVHNYDVMHHRTAGNCHYGAMSLATDDFGAAYKAVAGHELSGSPLQHIIRPRAALMSRLLKLHETVGRIAESAPDILALPEVTRALERELVHVMIRCLTEGEFSGLTPGGRRHDAIVARFEEFLEANPGKPLYLTEICAAIGVGERTLRVACEEHLGMGPIRFLSLRRMHLVRRALIRADPLTTTVTRLATDHGFCELGRFSAAYRELFGELPSQSLRRPADERRGSHDRPSWQERRISA